MQPDSLAIPQWILESLKWLAGIGAGGLIVRLVTLYQNRHKPIAELHRTDAETTEITVRASSSAGDAVMRMMDYLSRAQGTIDRLREERDRWQDEYDKVFTERDDARLKLEQAGTQARLDELQVRRLHGMVKVLSSILEENEIKIPDDCRIS